MNSWSFRTPEERPRPSDVNSPRAGASFNFRRVRTAFVSTIVALVALGALLTPQANGTGGGTFTVTNNADSTSGNSIAGSLRDGISAANSGACAAPCTIQFAITGNINLSTPLPIIATGATGLTIDGFTATGAQKNTAAFGSAVDAVLPVIVSSTSGVATAFDVAVTGVTIQGLVVSGFSGRGIRLGSTNGTVKGCFLGTTVSGTSAFSPAGATGVEVSAGTGNFIGGTLPQDRNVISGNTTAGVWISGGGATVIGNYIGTNAAGTAAIAGQPIGVRVDTGGNDIGTAAMGNVMSGNSQQGVLISAGSGSVVRNNRVGTNAAGTAAIPNNTGIYVGGVALPSGTTIGGSVSEGNLVSGNSGSGILVSNAGTTNVISQNNVGVNLIGNTAIQNAIGIQVFAPSSGLTINNNRVCGSTGDGIQLTGGTSSTITANDIGLYGATAISNAGKGISVSGVTGTTVITNNNIKNNIGNGVDVDGSTGVQITGNAMATNGTVGIDLHASAINSGPTANDGGDSDTGGGNRYQNYPSISSAYLNGNSTSATLTAQFTVDSIAVTGSQSFRVELFEADSSANPEGLRLLGSQCYAGNSNALQTMTVANAGLLVNSKIVATATSYSDTSCTNINDGTSEFSPATFAAIQPGFVVNTNDSGTGSLRQAILDANTGACAAPCSISFNIPTTDANYSIAAGTFTIQPLSAYSVLKASNTKIDGSTQTAFTGNTNPSGPEIVLDGINAGTVPGGLYVGTTSGNTSNVIIKDLVINRFNGYGVIFSGSSGFQVNGGGISGCYIGTNATGTAAAANNGSGILVQDANNIQIGLGGNFTGNGNLISGNLDHGIYMVSSVGTVSNITVAGNTIGADVTKTNNVANGQAGIALFSTTTNTTIGGGTIALANTIAFNGGPGVAVVGSTSVSNLIRLNSIFLNGMLGIDLGNDGFTGNDAGDGDSGPNNLQNAPVLSTATYNCATNQTSISGTLNSAPLTSFDIDWYSSPTADPSGYGEGKTYLNTSTWTTDSLGNANISIVVAGDLRNANVTATATRVSSTETSEFSTRPTANDSAPVTTNDTIVTTEDTPGSVNVVANDNDPECDAFTVTANSGAANGTVTCTTTTCTYTPNANFNGTDTFSYTVSDGTMTSTGSVSVNITAVNDPPVATNDALTTLEDTSATINVLANDTDVDGPSLTIVSNTAPSFGTATCQPTGNCTYAPNANFNGTDTFSYTVTDGTTPVTGNVTVTVTSVNDAPTFNGSGPVTVLEDSGAYSAAWATAISPGPANEFGQTVSFIITGNDNSPLFAVQPAISSAGTLTFTPAPNANGIANINVLLKDNGGTANGGSDASPVVSFSITVSPVNDPPVAVNDTASTSEDTPVAINVLLNDSDPESSPLSIVGSTNGTLGSVSCTSTVCTYTPNPNVSGTDSFTYTVSDGSSTSTANVAVNITAVNDPPVANGDSYSVAGNSTLTVAAPGVLSNDTDVDSAPPFMATVGSSTTHGTLTLNTDGSFSYTPAANYTGPDSFTYSATDGAGATSAPATVSINVVTAVNAADLSLAITDSPDPVLATSNVTYTVTVGNAGPNTNTAYSLTLNSAGGTIQSATGAATCSGAPSTSVSCTGTAISAGGNGTITVVVTAGGGPTVQLSGSISYAVDPNTANNTATQSTTVTASANLQIQKTLSTSLAAGQNATYTISVKNIGPSDATGVTVTDAPGAGLAFVSGSGACTSFPCNLGTLTAGSTVIFGSTFAVASNASGSISNTATVSSPVNDPVPSDNSATATGTVTSATDLGITKSGPAFGQPGGNISYAITVFNNGPADASGVVVNDTPPSRLTFVSASGACSSFPCNMGTIPAGSNKTVNALYSISAGPNATITNTATVTSTTTDTNAANNSSSASTAIGCPTAPGSLLPADGTQNVSTNGTLHWTNSGASSYRVYLGPAGSGCATLLGTTSSTSMAYSGLTAGTAYEWRVEAVSTGCATLSSSCIKFTTAINCNAAAPQLIAPLGGTQSSPITFSWTAVPNATLYHVFASVGGASSVEIGSTASTTLVATLGNGPTTWFVVADVPGCGSLQSATASFSTCSEAAPVAGVVAEAASGQTYDVSWQAVAGATKYEVDEATNADFNGATTQTVTTTSVTYTHNAITSAQPFFYRVRAFASCRNQFGPYSPTIRVVIAPIPVSTVKTHNANVPAGSKRVVVQQVFVPGFPDGSFPFTASVDQPWLAVNPSSGTLTPAGITLNVTADPANLPNGTFTGTVVINVITPNNSSHIAGRANRPLNVPVSVSLVTPVTPQPKTEPLASSLIIPSVGHLDGIASRWQSDIRVANTSTQKVHYQLTFTPQGDDASKGVKTTTIEIDPNATTALDDVVRNWYGVGSLGETANGVLEIRPLDAPNNQITGDATSSFTVSTVASSRTYNTTSTGTLGQYIPAIPFGSFIGKAPAGSNQFAQVLSLQQVAQSDAYRTNIGVVEASGKPASVLLSVFSTSGAKLLDYPLELRAGEQKQLNGFLAENGIALNDGRVEVKVTGGEGKVTAYASVVDNHTNDPLLVSGVPLTGASANRYVLPGVADINNGLASWRTDARIFNAGSTPQGATLTFYPQNNSGSPVANAITINPGEVRTLDNILQSFFGLSADGTASNLGGAVHVATPGASNLVVTGRTYNRTSEGTFGQYIPAVTEPEAVGAGSRALNILQVEDSPRYRTNLGLAEVTGKPAHVEVTINLPDARVAPRIEFDMQPNEFRQFGVISEMGLGNTYNARITVKVLGGEGKITAYGSVIDRETQDPTYVPAQ